MASYDCIVLGVGGFGSGALYHLACRGVSVLGIERFGIAHDRGSSHGETRIIRRAYIEHPDYIPLVDRAYELWEDLQAEAGRTLLHRAPLLLTGRPESEAVAGSRLARQQYGVDIVELPRAEAQARFPGLRFPDGFEIMLESSAGYLEVEACVRAHVQQAVARGAEVRTEEAVVSWSADNGTVTVTTDRDTYCAERLVVTAGAWAGRVLADLHLPLQVLRKPVFWHEVTSRDYDHATGAALVYYELPFGTFYAFPCLDGRTLKVAQHTGGEPVADPLHVDRALHPDDVAPIADFLRLAMPAVRTEPLRHSVCLYTNSPDRHFIVDRHPRHEQVVVAAGFSGHGFKFSGVLGLALAELALDGRTELPIGFLSLGRPALRGV